MSDENQTSETSSDEVAVPVAEIATKCVGHNPLKLVHESDGLRIRAMQIKTGVIMITESYDLSTSVFIPGATLTKAHGNCVEIR